LTILVQRINDSMAYAALKEAMKLYERAEGLRPKGDDDAILRWSACVRLLGQNPSLRPAPEETSEPPLE
jgi:hypothetical protein